MKIIKQFIKDKEFGLLSLFKELVAICVLFPLLYNFCNAQSLEHGIYSREGASFNNPLAIQGLSGYITCINGSNNDSFNHAKWTFDSTKVNDYSQMNTFTDLTGVVNRNTFCFEGDYILYLKPESVAYGSIDYYISKIKLQEKNCPSCPSCPSQYTSLECQSHYNLIPISSVDQNYCTTNNLCPISGGGDCTGANWSALYINGVQHDSAGIIDIDISEDISWDYNLTGSQFNLDIVGYNVDYEKINEIVSIQEYKPSSKDFTQVVGALVPYIKILVFLLFAFIIIKRLKKPFSSKLK